MQLRIMGTEEECLSMVRLIRENVPKEYIRSISDYYPNRRKNILSNEGRIYVSFKDGSVYETSRECVKGRGNVLVKKN